MSESAGTGASVLGPARRAWLPFEDASRLSRLGKVAGWIAAIALVQPWVA